MPNNINIYDDSQVVVSNKSYGYGGRNHVQVDKRRRMIIEDKVNSKIESIIDVAWNVKTINTMIAMDGGVDLTDLLQGIKQKIQDAKDTNHSEDYDFLDSIKHYEVNTAEYGLIHLVQGAKNDSDDVVHAIKKMLTQCIGVLDMYKEQRRTKKLEDLRSFVGKLLIDE